MKQTLLALQNSAGRLGMSMAISRLSPPPFENRVLDLLSASDCRRLQPHLELVKLDFKQVLYERQALIDCVYFPCNSVMSLLALMEDGSGIEVASIGREGMVGLGLLFGVEKAPAKIMVQIAGSAWRMKSDVLREETSQDTPLRRLLFLYERALVKQVMQSVACNGLHSLRQRCCRWLLMTRDRIDSDWFVMTHEFLAEMLGVRRSSVSEVLDPLQKKGLIHYQRGKIQILNGKGLENFVCECYRSVKVEYDRLFAGH
jgi:CRP-like cAMP-binding protein